MAANDDGVERRYDVDGEAYTREDFVEFYGEEAQQMWEAAEGRVEEGVAEEPETCEQEAEQGDVVAQASPFVFAPSTGGSVFAFGKDAAAAAPAAGFLPFSGSTDAIAQPPAPLSFPANPKAADVSTASSSDGAFSGSSTAAAVETIIAVAKGDDVFVCSKCNTPKPALVGDHLAGKTSVNSQCGSKKCSMKKRQFVRKSAMTEEQKGSVLAEPAMPQDAAPVAEAKPAVSNPFASPVAEAKPATSNPFASAAVPKADAASTNPFASAQVPKTDAAANPFASAQVPKTEASANPFASAATSSTNPFATTANPFAAKAEEAKPAPASTTANPFGESESKSLFTKNEAATTSSANPFGAAASATPAAANPFAAAVLPGAASAGTSAAFFQKAETSANPFASVTTEKKPAAPAAAEAAAPSEVDTKALAASSKLNVSAAAFKLPVKTETAAAPAAAAPSASTGGMYRASLDDGVAYAIGAAGSWLCPKCAGAKEMKAPPERLAGKVTLSSECKTCKRSVSFKWTPAAGDDASADAVPALPPLVPQEEEAPRTEGPVKPADVPNPFTTTANPFAAKAEEAKPAPASTTANPFGESESKSLFTKNEATTTSSANPFGAAASATPAAANPFAAAVLPGAASAGTSAAFFQKAETSANPFASVTTEKKPAAPAGEPAAVPPAPVFKEKVPAPAPAPEPAAPTGQLNSALFPTKPATISFSNPFTTGGAAPAPAPAKNLFSGITTSLSPASSDVAASPIAPSVVSSSDGAFSGSSTAAAVETIIAVAKGDDVFVCSKCNTPKPSLVGDHLAGKTSVNSQCGSKKCSMKKRQFVRKSAMTEEQKGSVLAVPAMPQDAAPVAEAKPAAPKPFATFDKPAAVDSGFSFTNAFKTMSDTTGGAFATPKTFGFPSMRPTPARNTTHTFHPLQRAIRPRLLRRRRRPRLPSLRRLRRRS